MRKRKCTQYTTLVVLIYGLLGDFSIIPLIGLLLLAIACCVITSASGSRSVQSSTELNSQFAGAPRHSPMFFASSRVEVDNISLIEDERGLLTSGDQSRCWCWCIAPWGRERDSECADRRRHGALRGVFLLSFNLSTSSLSATCSFLES